MLILALDLMLLKRGVYRHLLFNRGRQPRRVMSTAGDRKVGDVAGEDLAAKDAEEKNRERVGQLYLESDRTNSEHPAQQRWLLIDRLGGALVAVDACTSSGFTIRFSLKFSLGEV